MKKLIESIPLAFFSRTFYADLITQGSGIGMGFILLLTLLAILESSFHGYKPLQATKAGIVKLTGLLPELTIENGQLSIDRPVPYAITLEAVTPETPEELQGTQIVFDTKYTPEDIDSVTAKMRQEKIVVLVTANHIIIRQRKNDIRIHPIETSYNTVVTQEVWRTIGEKVSRLLIPIIAIIGSLYLFLSCFFSVVLVAVITLLAGKATKTITDYSTAMRLTAAALLPINILSILVVPQFWLGIAIWVGYIGFGIWSVRQPPTQPNTV